MTGTTLGPQKSVSGLTFSLLKDAGWYTVDDTFNDTTNYGYQKGCTFYNNACFGGTSFSTYFCDSVALNGNTLCASNFLGKSTCNISAAYMADGCGIFTPFTNCVDPATSDGFKSFTLESYSTSSFCVISTLGNIAISSLSRGRCYPYVCSITPNTITFTIGTYNIACL